MSSEFLEDTCEYCGAHIGWGIALFHLGVCDDPDCQAQADAADTEPEPEPKPAPHD